MSQTYRTFIAVELPAAVVRRAAQLAEQLAASQALVKWVEPESFHVTLKFLGEVHPEGISAVGRAIERGVRDLQPFECEYHGAGAFPTTERPRTVWLGTRAGTEQMIQLHDGIDQQLAELGYRTEHRRFRPHVTIGRVRRSFLGLRALGQLISEHADFAAGTHRVSQVVVFSSRLTRQGPQYKQLASVPLGGR